MILTYKYRLKDKRAAKTLRAQAYAVNQVWNWCVAQHRNTQARYQAGSPSRRWPSAFDLGKECKGVGAALGIHQQTVGATCHEFAKVRGQHKRAPRFRASFGQARARGWIPFERQSRQISGNGITYLGKTYRFFGASRRPLPVEAKGGFFVEDSLGRWWVCFHVEAERIGAGVGAVGVDLGLKDFATLSTGEKIAAPQFFRQSEAALATAQRARSGRRARAIQCKIANRRRDFHHKLSTRLAREYAFIAVGDVSPKRLARTRMAKSIHDAGWSAFRNTLRYKAATFVEADERFTTQTCSSCGALPPERPRGIAGLGMRSWDCSACGASHDRDVNAALNILRIGRSATPLAEGSRSRGRIVTISNTGGENDPPQAHSPQDDTLKGIEPS